MPLDDGYGVLIGDLVSHERDPDENFGQWFHLKIKVDAAGVEYEGAIDVDSKTSDIGVEWRVVPIAEKDIAPVLAMGDGFHDLPSTPTSGAIDYIRSPMFRVKLGCVFVMMPSPLLKLLMKLFEGLLNQWTQGNYLQASEALEEVLDGAGKCLVWGEPYTSDNGLHNIHQNQGDPPGDWYEANGIWQDGGTIVQKPDGSWVAFINKFTSQAYTTNDLGQPL